MEEQQQHVTQALLSWYDQNARVLPWRNAPTPYRVWVSEIMLQQTQVQAVVPYFERFMRALPDVKALAEASEEELNKLWEGLGYYSRARNLKRAAECIVEQYDGELPADYLALLKLPGVGEYTAGAIASIAFGLPLAAVDGNVLRVFARLHGIEDDITDTKVKKRIQTIVAGYVPAKRPGDFNQSLMELGACVCLPKTTPHCDECPIQPYCLAYHNGKASLLPVKSAKKPRQIQKRSILLLKYQDRILIKKRPPKGLLAGLWEFPSLEGWLDEKELAAYLKAHGFQIESIRPVANAKHIFTHREWHMQGWVINLTEILWGVNGQWVTARELQEVYAIPGAYRTYAKMVPAILAELR